MKRKTEDARAAWIAVLGLKERKYVGEGVGHTAEEMMELLKVGRCKLTDLMEAAIKAGKVEKCWRKQQTGAPVVVYLLKGKK